MDPTLLILGTSVIAGFVGGLMGLGGGVILVPVLVTFLDVPLRLALGASLMGVVATSTAGAATYVRQGLSNLRLGLLLSAVAVGGALVGIVIGKVAGERIVTGMLAAMLMLAAWAMLRRPGDRRVEPGTGTPVERRPHLDGAYFDPSSQSRIEYGVRNLWSGTAFMFVAGIVSSMLGVGGGVVQIPVMDTLMWVPMKAATATSNFMIGITAATGAVAYIAMGEVHPAVAAPVVVGVFVGSTIGARVMPRVRDTRLRMFFVLIMMLLAVDMAYKAISGVAG
jgi:uncharacterized membrane protein YfcA